MAHETASTVGVETDITCARGCTRRCMRYCSPIPTWRAGTRQALASLSATKCLISCDIAHPPSPSPSSSLLFATLSLACAAAGRRFQNACHTTPASTSPARTSTRVVSGLSSPSPPESASSSREGQALLAKASCPIIGHTASSPRAQNGLVRLSASRARAGLDYYCPHPLQRLPAPPP